MKKIYISLFLFILFILNSYSQSGWYYVNMPSGTASNFNCVYFINQMTGWAGGEQILKTTDGGDNWLWQSNIQFAISDFYFLNSNTGFGIGSYGGIHLSKTTNGGTNWSLINFASLGNMNFSRIYAASLDTLFIVGYQVGVNTGYTYKTINGGVNWSQINPSSSSWLNGITFINSNTGFIYGGAGIIFRSADRGTSWTTINNTGHSILKMKFIDEMTGWAVGGSGTIIKTTDGGLNWFTQMTGMDSYYIFNGVSFFNSNSGFAVGYYAGAPDSNIIYLTKNGGTNWIYMPTITNKYLYDVAFNSSNSVIISGQSGQYQTLIKSNTMGYSLPSTPTLHTPYNNSNGVSLKPNFDWNDVPYAESYNIQISENSSFNNPIVNYTIPSPTSNYLPDNCILYSIKNYYWRVRAINTAGNGSWSSVFTFFTTNYNVWTQQYYNDAISNNSIYVIDSLTGWIVGNNGKIMKTTSGGDCWFSQLSSLNKNFNNVFFLNFSTGWISGDSGIILKTSNSGNNWVSISSGITNKLKSIFFTSDNSGWIVGNNGILINTTNSGQNWNIKNSGVTTNINSIFFISSSLGWFCGDGGIAYKTINGGDNWISLNTNSSSNLNSIIFINSTSGWTAGQNGTVLKTTNGGDNWFTQNSHTTYNLNQICLSNSDKGWISGDNGKLIATSSGGSDWVVQNINISNKINSVAFFVNKGWLCGSDGIIYHTNSGTIITSIHKNTNEIPNKYCLYQNYPNPFNPSTIIKFDLPENSDVSMKIYDIQGKEIVSLINNEKLKAGNYYIDWNGERYSSGVYFCKISAGNYSRTVRMVLLK
jgi:photosystem II stability/assembly factor-like uncharacterized protein